MNTVSAPSERSEAPLFSDGLGDRVVAVDGATGDLLQILRLRPQLLAVPSFEFALRERAARLANFRHAHYARVRRVDRHPAGLAIVSDHVEGTRLSDILRVASERRLHLDLNAALCLIRQLVPAVALLHENARDVAHGAIAAERVIVTPHGRLVLVEHVLGSAIEQLQFNRERLWHELRVAVPSIAGPPRFDHRADVTAMGVIALALILGRPIRAEEYPQHAGALLSAAIARSALGQEQPLPASLRTWVARALQIDPRHGFPSAIDAQSAFEDVLGEDTGFVAAPVALETFLSRYIAALLEPTFVETSPFASASAFADTSTFADASTFAEATVDKTVDKPVFGEALAATPVGKPASAELPAFATPASSQFAAGPAKADVPSSRPSPNDVEALKAEFMQALAETPDPDSVQAATASLRPRATSERPASRKPVPASRKAVPEASVRKEAPAMPVVTAARPPKPLVVEAPKPVVTTPPARVEAEIVKSTAPVATKPIDPPDITELLRTIDASAAPLKVEPARLDEERMFEPEPEKTRNTGSRWRRIAVAVLVLVAIAEGAVIALRRKPAVATNGMLSVQTNPPGVAVFVDGEARGSTPARLSLSAGSHIVELRGRGVPRVIPVNVTAGAEVSQYLELPETPSAGSLLVQSDPPGARVTVDGVEHGVAPVSVADLPPGDHEVVLQAQGGAPVRQRVMIQAGVTSSVLAPVVAAQGPVSGWLSVKAPVMMEIKEAGRLIGTTDSDRLMMSAGRHEIELVNETLGYRGTKVVQVPAGKVAAVPVELPQGIVNINALPWAEVWIDGKRVGETPIGNLAVTIGPHEMVFRHPQFGEKKQAVSVTMHAPVRLSVDMK
jgi:serine/threonine protein kinase